ncbi:MAG: hypothetical protein PVI86_00620 [Phycisphaerae bacterium]|jgi:hypothetical protein
MLLRRKFALLVCLLLVPGSLSVTIAYALHLRSNSYRRGFERALTDRLGMRVTVGGVRPLTLSDRALVDVVVRRPHSDEQVFACAHAFWRTDRALAPPNAHDPSARESRAPTSVLELNDGWLLVGAAAWQPKQYRQMITGGLGHDFAALGLREVRARKLDLRFAHPSAQLTADDAAGTVFFDEYGEGHASFACLKLNNVNVERPVTIIARFTPGKRLVFHEVRLTVPTIPIASLGLEKLLGRPTSCGDFEGSIAYRELHESRIVEVNGRLHGAQLADFTVATPGGPFHGIIDAGLDAAVFRDKKLESLAFHGRVADLHVGEVLPNLIEPAAEGLLNLEVDQMRWVSGRIVHLSTYGTCSDLSLDTISRLWDRGRITGTVRVTIRSLLIVDDELRLGDVEINAVPPRDGPGLIDRSIIAEAVNQRFGFDASAALPENIEYARLGVRLILDNGRLRVLGTHGRDRRTILTVMLFGQSLGVVRQPRRTFEVPDLLQTLRQQAGDIDVERLQTWWERLQTAHEPTKP